MTPFPIFEWIDRRVLSGRGFGKHHSLSSRSGSKAVEKRRPFSTELSTAAEASTEKLESSCGWERPTL